MASSRDTYGASRKRGADRAGTMELPATEATLLNAHGEWTRHELHGTRRLKDKTVEVLFECTESGAIRRWGRIAPTVVGGKVVMTAVQRAEQLFPGSLFPKVRLSQHEFQLMACERLHQFGATTCHVIAMYMGRADSCAARVLGELCKCGHVERNGRIYRLTPAGERWYRENVWRIVDWDYGEDGGAGGEVYDDSPDEVAA